MTAGTAIRRGTIVAVPLSLVLVWGAPAFAATLAPGDACTTSDVLDPGLTCENGVVTPATAPSPGPTDSSSDAGTGTAPEPSTSPQPSPPPAQLPDAGSLVPDASADPGGGTATGGTTSGGSTTGSTSGLPAGTTAPAVSAPSTSSATPNSAAGGPSADQPSASTAEPAGVGGPGAAANTLLRAADLAMAPPGDLPSLGAVRSVTVRRILPPGAVQSPELAGLPPLASLPPAHVVAAIQSPLLAVGEQAAGGGG